MKADLVKAERLKAASELVSTDHNMHIGFSREKFGVGGLREMDLCKKTSFIIFYV